MNIFNKEYSGEDLYQLEADIIDSFNKKYDNNPDDCIFDKEGLLSGKFTVTIKWEC